MHIINDRMKYNYNVFRKVYISRDFEMVSFSFHSSISVRGDFVHDFTFGLL